MGAEIVSTGLSYLTVVLGLVGLTSIVLVVVAVVDVSRRPGWQMDSRQKALWILPMVLGLLLLGLVGGVLAAVYLFGVRPRFAALGGIPPGRAGVDAPPTPPFPVAAPAPLVPAGWYPDPSGQFPARWWDGRGWTGYVR